MYIQTRMVYRQILLTEAYGRLGLGLLVMLGAEVVLEPVFRAPDGAVEHQGVEVVTCSIHSQYCAMCCAWSTEEQGQLTQAREG